MMSGDFIQFIKCTFRIIDTQIQNANFRECIYIIRCDSVNWQNLFDFQFVSFGSIFKLCIQFMNEVYWIMSSGLTAMCSPTFQWLLENYYRFYRFLLICDNFPIVYHFGWLDGNTLWPLQLRWDYRCCDRREDLTESSINFW